MGEVGHIHAEPAGPGEATMDSRSLREPGTASRKISSAPSPEPQEPYTKHRDCTRNTETAETKVSRSLLLPHSTTCDLLEPEGSENFII